MEQVQLVIFFLGGGSENLEVRRNENGEENFLNLNMTVFQKITLVEVRKIFHGWRGFPDIN